VRRRTAFWLVLALVGLIMVPVVSAIVFSLLDEDGVFGLIGSVDDEVLAYFTVSASSSRMRSCRSSPARRR
jgi:membrane protein YqaA with SNARE-associated domain